MAFVPSHDRVLEHSVSNSQTIFAVTGAVDASYNAFSASMSIGDTTIGGIVEPGIAFASGVLTYSNTNEVTLSATKESKGTFSSSGTKQVFMGQPASVALMFDGAQSLTAARQNQAQKNLGLPAVMRSYLAGLGLSTAGSSSTFSIAPGVAADSTNADMMTLAAALAKTTGSWAVGSTNGALDVGTIANATWYYPHLIKRIDTQVVDALISLAPNISSVVTISLASPGQVSWTKHGLQANAPVMFSTTGALPTGLTAGTQYYVKTVVDVDTFTVSATQGGTAINTSVSQSGTHTAASAPILPANYTLSRRIGSLLTDGSAHWTLFKQYGDEFTWGVPVLDINNTSFSTLPTSFALSVPGGINVEVVANVYITRAALQVGLLVWNPELADQAVSETASPLTNLMVGTNGGSAIVGAGQIRVRTNTASQIRAVAQSASTTFRWATVSYIDNRGRLL